MNELIGINAKATNPISFVKKFNNVREYHDCRLDTTHISNQTQPGKIQASSPYSFGNFYKNSTLVNLKISASEGVKVDSFNLATLYKMLRLSPIKTNTFPFSQANQALVKEIEIWNEQDKNGNNLAHNLNSGTNSLLLEEIERRYSLQYTPEQYGALLSTFSRIKSINPNIKVSMGGLSEIRSGYVNRLTQWLKDNRTSDEKLIPFDIINVHHYSTRSNASIEATSSENDYTRLLFDSKLANGKQNFGFCPEMDGLKDRLAAFMDETITAHPELLEKEFIISEFGYDSHEAFDSETFDNDSGIETRLLNPDGTPSTVPIDYAMSQLIQAQWMTRSFLEISAAGSDPMQTDGIVKRISRAYAYELEDQVEKSPDGVGTFSLSGLITKSEQPKKAWYHVQTLRNVLKDYHFVSENSTVSNTNGENVPVVNTGSNANRSYLYENEDGQQAVVVWSPTAQGTGVSFPGLLNLDEGISTITQVEFRDLDENGFHTPRTTLSPTATAIPITVTETPVIYLIDQTIEEITINPVINLTAETDCCDGVRLNWEWEPGALFPPQGVKGYKFYYANKAEFGNNPANFDISRVTYHSDMTNVPRTKFITGLAPGDYFFFVFPISFSLNPPAPTMANLNASVVEVTITDNCPPNTGDCILPIQSSWLTIESGQGTVARITEALAIGVDDTCEDITNPTFSLFSEGWTGYDYSENAKNRVTIDLMQNAGGEYQKINSLYIRNGAGNSGRVLVEYKNCTCDNWQTFGNYGLEYNSWLIISNKNNIPVSELRITKGNDQGRISQVYICSEDSDCDPLTDGFAPNDPSGLYVTDITKKSAKVAWNASFYNENNPAAGTVGGYVLRYSKQATANGELIDPVVLPVFATENTAEIEVEINGLQKGVNYYGDVSLPTPEEFEVFELAGLADPDCPPDRVPVRKLFGFTTNDDKGSEERSEREDFLRSEQALSTFPNPAGGTLNIVVPAKSQHLQLYSFTGQILYQADIQGQTAYKLDTNDLIQGQYFVRIVDENGKVFGSSFIKM